MIGNDSLFMSNTRPVHLVVSASDGMVSPTENDESQMSDEVVEGTFMRVSVQTQREKRNRCTSSTVYNQVPVQ